MGKMDIFKYEEQRLKKVIALINNKIKYNEELFNKQKNTIIGVKEAERGAHFTRQGLMSLYATEIYDLKSVLSNPYFGMFEFESSGKKNEIYLGRKAITDGTNVIAPIYTPIWLTLDLANQASVAQNGIGAGTNIIGKAFFETFTFGGCVLGFVILMAFFAKSSQYKSLGRLSLVPALFGITEPVIFGTPLVLNFTFFMPFVFGNVIAILISYAAIASGLVPTLMGASTIFGLPIGFHAAIQGSWQAVVLQIVVMVILGLVWYPFFRKADNDAYKLEQEAAK